MGTSSDTWDEEEQKGYSPGLGGLWLVRGRDAAPEGRGGGRGGHCAFTWVRCPLVSACHCAGYRISWSAGPSVASWRLTVCRSQLAAPPGRHNTPGVDSTLNQESLTFVDTTDGNTQCIYLQGLIITITKEMVLWEPWEFRTLILLRCFIQIQRCSCITLNHVGDRDKIRHCRHPFHDTDT